MPDGFGEETAALFAQVAERLKSAAGLRAILERLRTCGRCQGQRGHQPYCRRCHNSGDTCDKHPAWRKCDACDGTGLNQEVIDALDDEP